MHKTQELDLSWGNPYFLLDTLKNKPNFYGAELHNMIYEENNGNPDLLRNIDIITRKLTGQNYKHYLITNGATQAINIVMRVWEKHRKLVQCTTSPLSYPYYPGMIDKTYFLYHNKAFLPTYKKDDGEMLIIDSPSNPFGDQIGGYLRLKEKNNIIWDAVYHNPIYNADKYTQPMHEVYVNSFSKLLGLTGARVGWIATNNTFDYERYAEEALYENATVSKISQELVLDVLSYIDLDDFMVNGRNILNHNREILQDLSSLLGEDVQDKGMFYCAQADNRMFDLFNNAGIKHVRMKHKDSEYIRLNIGQTSDILESAVIRIKNKDRRRQ